MPNLKGNKGKPKDRYVSRRQVVAGIAAASALSVFPLRHSFASTQVVDPFLKVSSFLTGIMLDKSYSQLGIQIWQALILNANTQDVQEWQALVDNLDALPIDATDAEIEMRLTPMGHSTVLKAQKLARVWYTGRIKQDDGVVLVINYDEALVWQACDFTKPPVTCGGPFGYWAKPYQGGKSS